jgi:RNA polymerase sigma-70 factor (ECF subfamily)
MGEDVFERLWEAHAHRLVGFLIYRTGDRALAEDVVAETFERVVRARRAIDPHKGSEKTWIYSIALNLVRDHTRRSRVEERALERAVAVGAESDRGANGAVEDRDVIMRAMSDLGGEEREAIALRYIAELTIPEIGRLTGQSPKTIEGRVYRALRKMRDEVAE